MSPILSPHIFDLNVPEASCLSSFFRLIFKTGINQYIFQDDTNLASPFEFIKHPPLDSGIHMNPLEIPDR
ncbi:hypothetical protein [Desulfobacter sp.]|uniref:hypothetical protein n=1 Tax=Desulfobacter sp. TaxID=2294 RepID=UPI002580BD97|nr:hypothetical protein [Desulfobacter sp.]